MASQGDVSLKISADLAEFKAAMAQAAGEIRKFSTTVKSHGVGDLGFGSIKGSVDGARAALRSFAASLVTLATVASTIKIADDFANLQARLKLVTDGTDELVAAQERLFQISQKTGQSFTDVAELYTKLAQATKGSGTSQEALLQVVETINQAVALSGASSSAANAALIQLGQGLASGTLRGEELNSVLEQTPVLADAIAKGMGITRGELRKYGQEGKITSDAVLNALLKQREEIDKQAQTIPVTFGRAVTQLKNSLTLLVGEFDQAAGGTSGLAGAIKDLADFLTSDEVRGAMIELGKAWGDAFRDIAQDFRDAAAIINIDSGGLVSFVGRAFKELPVNVRTAVRIATIEIAAFVDATATSFKGVADYISAVFDPDKSIEDVRRALVAQQAAIKQAREEAIAEALADRQKLLDGALDSSEAAKAARLKAAGSQGTVTVGKPKAQAKFNMPELQKALDESFRLTKDALDRESRALDDALEQRRISIADWYAEKDRIAEEQFASERQRLEQERAEQAAHLAKVQAMAKNSGKPEERQRAEKEIAKTKNDVAKIDADLIILERERASTLAKIAADAAQKEREYQKLIEDTRIALQRAQGDDLGANLAEIERARKDALARAQNGEDAALFNKLYDTQKARAEFEDLQRQFEEISGRYERGSQLIDNQVQAGSLSPDQAQAQQSEMRQQTVVELNNVSDAMQRLAVETNNPAIIEGAQKAQLAVQEIAKSSSVGIKAAIENLQAQLKNLKDTMATTLANDAADGLTQMFTSIADGSKSAGDAIKDFVRGFAQSMIQLAARALATFLVLQALDAIYPGLGKMASASMGAGVKHRGGMAGTGPVRRVSPLMFAGAPRYHSGGVVGLQPNEVPAILQKGEEVLAKNDPRNVTNGGASGGGTRIINVIDPNMVGDYMSSSAGEKVVLNVLQRNPGTVKQIINS